MTNNFCKILGLKKIRLEENVERGLLQILREDLGYNAISVAENGWPTNKNRHKLIDQKIFEYIGELKKAKKMSGGG